MANLPVYRLIVPLAGYDFRCQVVRRPTKCPRNIWNLLGEAEVGDLQMPMPVKEQIFGLQISIDDVVLVQILDCQGDFGSIELCYRIGKPLRQLSAQSKCVPQDNLPGIFSKEKTILLLQ